MVAMLVRYVRRGSTEARTTATRVCIINVLCLAHVDLQAYSTRCVRVVTSSAYYQGQHLQVRR